MAYSEDGINWITVPDSTFGSDNILGIAWGTPPMSTANR
jgi:hypothetical protein